MSQNISPEDNQLEKEYEQETPSTTTMQEILPGLYLGDVIAAENVEDLRSKNISFVLSIKHLNLLPATRDAYCRVRISHIHIRKTDRVDEDLISLFEPACDMIDGKLAKGKAVLVHCAVGRSRSATVVIAYVMRHLKITCKEAYHFVRTKRPAINPNSGFREQLKMWETCRFDLQNLLVMKEKPDSDPLYLIRTAEVKEGMAEEEEEAEQEARRRQEEGEEHKKCVDDKEGEESKKEQESRGNKKADEEGKDKEQDEVPREDSGKEEAKTEASPSAQYSACELTSPQSIDTSPSKELQMLVESREPQNVDDHSAADGTCDCNDPAGTQSPSPGPETVHAAIKPLYLKYPAMGKKKLLRILNAGQGWSIGNKEFRSYLEAISD